MRAYRSQVRAPKCWLAENLLLYHMVKELFSLRATRKWTEIFHQFCENELEDCFNQIGWSLKERLFVMDNDPSQTSRVLRQALAEIRCKMQEIQARSPDLNPIENLFHNSKKNSETRP